MRDRALRSIALALCGALSLALAACGRSGVSDDAITENISIRLERSPELGRQEVRVATHEGVVTLTGRVERPAQRGEAEQIARATEGVKDVQNHIEAGLESATPTQPDVGAGPGARVPAEGLD
jgi:hyperosmotically inducible protein